MEQSLRNDDFGFKDTNVKILKKTTENVMLTKKSATNIDMLHLIQAI